MNDKDFKAKYKMGVCTNSPWKPLIPEDIREETMRQIRKESIELHGLDLDQCPKRFVCLTKTCIGRPLPELSPTAKPYLEQLKKTHKVINGELFISNCDTCTIAKSCKAACWQVNDFMNRQAGEQPNLIYQESLEQHDEIQQPISMDTQPSVFNNLEIPWDCISEAKQNLVKMYLFERKDFISIGKILNIKTAEKVRYQFYAALTKLSEYAIIRKFIENKEEKLTEKQALIMRKVYIDNSSLTSVAKEYNITKQSVQQLVAKVIKQNNLKWHVFVKKRKNKVIYNIPAVLR